MDPGATAGPRNPADMLERFRAAKAADDVARMAAIALAMPTSQRFGVHPGLMPGLIHEAYLVQPAGLLRTRLACALARAWAYGGDANRAARFADQARREAEEHGDPAAIADALDAQLLTRWGPDDVQTRRTLALRLAEVAAHLVDPEAQLSTQLWLLVDAWESLDLTGVRRHLRALDVLAEESGSPRVAFFAAARRAMYLLVAGRLEEAQRLINQLESLGRQADEPDTTAVVYSLKADLALQQTDRGWLQEAAGVFEEYGESEGIRSVLTEAGVLYAAAGDLAQAQRIGGVLLGDLTEIPADVDWLLTVSKSVSLAASVGDAVACEQGARLLEPYAGRVVLNAGVAFHGVVDDYLFQAHGAVGSGQAQLWRERAAVAYRRLGAPWWLERLGTSRGPGVVVELHPQASGSWLVGRRGAAVAVPGLRGFEHLRTILAQPGVHIPAAYLAAAAAGHPGTTVVQHDTGDLLDGEAKAAYRHRLHDLESALIEADARGDASRSAALSAEREAILAELRRAAGIGGRTRRSGSSEERARVAVRKSISAAIERIAGIDPGVARMLTQTVHTGFTCWYDPDPDRPVHWVLD